MARWSSTNKMVRVRPLTLPTSREGGGGVLWGSTAGAMGSSTRIVVPRAVADSISIAPPARRTMP
ncbi:MAG: hypothetical protein IPG04_05305 [Polyangiaceae bacterium]|nr:hypothetical protein [Polyangiaceae bacterium]